MQFLEIYCRSKHLVNMRHFCLIFHWGSCGCLNLATNCLTFDEKAAICRNHKCCRWQMSIKQTAMPTLIDNTWHENDFSYFTSGMIVQVFTAFVQAKLFEEQVVTRQLLSSCLSRSPSKSLCRTCLHFSKKHLQKIYTILNITRGTNWF